MYGWASLSTPFPPYCSTLFYIENSIYWAKGLDQRDTGLQFQLSHLLSSMTVYYSSSLSLLCQFSNEGLRLNDVYALFQLKLPMVRRRHCVEGGEAMGRTEPFPLSSVSRFFCVYSIYITPWGRLQAYEKYIPHFGSPSISLQWTPLQPCLWSAWALIPTFRYSELSFIRFSPDSQITFSFTSLLNSSLPQCQDLH